MATIFDVAKYILEKQGVTSTLKLQKLCYYAQAWVLAWDEVPLFAEDFQAWVNGAVCPELYLAYGDKFSITANELDQGCSDNLTDEDKRNIDIVLQSYGDKEPYWLRELIHLESPWKNARMDLPKDAPSTAVISKESMLNFYSGLLDEK